MADRVWGHQRASLRRVVFVVDVLPGREWVHQRASLRRVRGCGCVWVVVVVGVAVGVVVDRV